MKIGQSITRTIHMKRQRIIHKGLGACGYLGPDSRDYFKLRNGWTYRIIITREKAGKFALIFCGGDVWLYEKIKGLPLKKYPPAGISSIGYYCLPMFNRLFPDVRQGFYNINVKRLISVSNITSKKPKEKK